MTSIQSEAVARTWLDPEVAAKRAAHHGLMVDGQAYSSTFQAFKALGIASKANHRKWRLEFKNLVDRQIGVLVKGYPMPDGNFRDVMLIEAGAGAVTPSEVVRYSDLEHDNVRNIVPEVKWDPADEEEAIVWCERRALDPQRDGYVYLMCEVGDLAGQIKVGLSDDVERRQFELTQGRPWNLVKAKGPMPYWQARALESAVLAELKKACPDAHLMGEFFQLEQSVLKYASNQLDVQLEMRTHGA